MKKENVEKENLGKDILNMFQITMKVSSKYLSNIMNITVDTTLHTHMIYEIQEASSYISLIYQHNTTLPRIKQAHSLLQENGWQGTWLIWTLYTAE